MSYILLLIIRCKYILYHLRTTTRRRAQCKIFFVFCILYAMPSEHGCKFSRVKYEQEGRKGLYFSDWTRWFLTNFKRKSEKKLFQGMNAFYRVQLFFLPKPISYFSIHDLDFFSLIVFLLSVSTVKSKISLLKLLSESKRCTNIANKKVCNFHWFASQCDVILLLPELNTVPRFWQILKTYIVQCRFYVIKTLKYT